MATFERGVASCASNPKTTSRMGTSMPPPPIPPPAATAHAKKMRMKPSMSLTSIGKRSLCTHSPRVWSGLSGRLILRQAGLGTSSATHSISSPMSAQSASAWHTRQMGGADRLARGGAQTRKGPQSRMRVSGVHRVHPFTA
eukprot:scaffold103129_cov35-Tisochrysis_lutea.AAC.1